MSIAVSTVVKPSRLLLAATLAMCLLCACGGYAIGAGVVGRLALPIRITAAVICFFLSLWVGWRTVQSRKTHHIDISGRGQIRLMENGAVTAPSLIAGAGTRPGNTGRVDHHEQGIVSLMSGSTLWPGLLLLRLQTEDRRVITLPVLPDSVEEGGFRRLALACRWIAAHNNPESHAHSSK